MTLIDRHPRPPQFGWPTGWQLFCHSSELGRRPLTRTIHGRPLVAFRDEQRRPAVLDSRCVHMGADLGCGDVIEGTLRCPFHHWQFDRSGQCVRIPSGSTPPDVSRPPPCMVREAHGLVLVAPHLVNSDPLPFFENMLPEELHRARPMTFQLECPWHMVGINAIDVQHFVTAHDRRMLAWPRVDQPHPRVFRTRSQFAVEGSGWRDGLTRRVAGDTVTMQVHDHAGSMMLVTAEFRHTTSYGLVAVRPVDADNTQVSVTVFVRRSRSAIGRRCFDPLNAHVRRHFIRSFLLTDVPRSQGTDFNLASAVADDALVVDYCDWLMALNDSPTHQSPWPCGNLDTVSTNATRPSTRQSMVP